MKGIIVVDIPEACVDCQFCAEFSEGIEAYCILKINEDEFREIDDYCQYVPEWCPIKPLPEKMKASRGMMNRLKDEIRGYNFCIDKILKGNKENEKD